MKENKLVRTVATGLLLALTASSFASVAHAQSSSAGVITVTNTADSGAGSFRQAITDAQENDTINFAPDVRGTISLMSGELLISKALTIQGPGATLLTIDAGYISRLLRIDADGRTVSISGLTFTRGFALSVDGGGIWNNSNLTLTACTVSNCRPVPGTFGAYDARGGGVFNQSGSSIQLVRCTLTGNGVTGGSFHGGTPGSGQGGALWNGQGATASLQNCTISENSATGGPVSCGLVGCSGPGSGIGGGIYNAGNLVITACTIASNAVFTDSVSFGGGLWNAGNAQITNSIVAKNTGGVSPDAAGPFESDGFNLIGTSNGNTGFTAIGDQTGTTEAPLDPKLGPLQDNGGPTWTRALLSGSQAIDAGISASLSTDQRGGVRTHDYTGIPNSPGGDGTDIGSFELGGLDSRLGNISTRLHVGTGDNALIGGFIITGTEAKTVIVRGLGPSLPVPGALTDPVIEVHGSSGEILATNDDWINAATSQQIIDSGLAPASNLESAFWGIINPGAYTVVVRGKNDATGIGLFDVYDLDGSVDSKLGNISTRGFVDIGDNVMIGGTIIIGNTPTRMLLRAIGPSLTNFGVPGALQDPTLELHDGNGALIASNDNWRSDQEAEIIATTIPPSSDLESAIVATLNPDSYTAIVRGTDNTTGVAVVEAYALP